MDALTPHEVEQLVSLRLALENALLQCNRATKYRRGTALVALDTVVERASAIVAVTSGVPVPKSGNLDDLISKLKESLGERWVPGVLPDIRQLRRPRNAAQHEGLEPDREQIPSWASAVAVYVTTLIDTQCARHHPVLSVEDLEQTLRDVDPVVTKQLVIQTETRIDVSF